MPCGPAGQARQLMLDPQGRGRFPGLPAPSLPLPRGGSFRFAANLGTVSGPPPPPGGDVASKRRPPRPGGPARRLHADTGAAGLVSQCNDLLESAATTPVFADRITRTARHEIGVERYTYRKHRQQDRLTHDALPLPSQGPLVTDAGLCLGVRRGWVRRNRPEEPTARVPDHREPRGGDQAHRHRHLRDLGVIQWPRPSVTTGKVERCQHFCKWASGRGGWTGRPRCCRKSRRRSSPGAWTRARRR